MSREHDEKLMRRAIAAARSMLGDTWPNPSVGCVIARGEVVLAEAATGAGGRPHAEEQALAQIGEAARGAVVYVSLEPCGQRSAGGPSCSERLVAAGVSRVVIAAENPERLSAGQGLERLREAGVPAELGFLSEEAEPLYRAFRHRLRTSLPMVEASVSGEGFDGPFAVNEGEGVEAALRRLADAGYARLWVMRGGELADQLKSLGFLTEDGPFRP